MSFPEGIANAPTPLRTDAPVVANDALGAGNHRLVVSIADWPGADPGQFLMISPGALDAVARFDPLLPRPMAVYRERATGAGACEVEILYKVTGRGTTLLAAARPGQRVRVVGPLGRGFAPPRAGASAILVGGGTGIASLYGLASVAGSRGETRVLLGARSADDLMGGDDFAALDVRLEVATEDGSAGSTGLVTALLERALDDARDRAPVVYACGPTPMMRRCAEIADARGVSCIVSLENGMACGFGVCLGCAAPRRSGGYALVCREGPVFDAASVAWEGLP